MPKSTPFPVRSVLRSWQPSSTRSLDTSIGSTCTSTWTRSTAVLGWANQYAAAGGPTVETLLVAIHEVFRRFQVDAAAVTAYDPTYDSDGQVAAAARELIAAIAEGAAEQSGSVR